MADKRVNPYIVQPVMKALKVLELVAERGHDLSLTAISKRLSIPKTTTFRYLQTLTGAGFLVHDSRNDCYGIGPRFRTIAKADTSLHNLRSIARPLMLELVGEFNETVNLAIRGEGGNVVYVDIVEANRSLRIQGRVGDRHPMHSTALGKAILGFVPAAEQRSYLDQPLMEMTGRTLIDKSYIERQLREVAKLGYATEQGENEDGAMCVAAPILDETARAIAAVSVSAPLQRMPRSLAATAGLRLVGIAQRITTQLVNEYPV
ncbi:MAG: hypothetical protein JWR75_1328 [Devosia sp.]|nr:hypothetical protein [Devosia sp.]